MTKILFVFVVILLVALSTLASGTMQLEGKIRSFSPDSVEINDGHQIYVLERKKLGPTETEKLQNLKFGSKIKLTVPFDAVSAVKPLK